MTAAILVKYKSNKWNKILPTWIICISPLLLLLLGVGIGKLIFNRQDICRDNSPLTW